MNKRCVLALIAFVALIGVGRVNAQYLTGTVTGEESVTGPFGSATASSMRLTETNMVQSATGSFSGIVPLNTIVYSSQVNFSGLSTTPKAFSNNLLEFGTGSFPGRFTFTLDTLAEDSYDSTTGAATFTGTGTIADGTGEYQDTSADLTVDFTSQQEYSFTLEAVPEPATASLGVAGLFGLWAWRTRRG